MLFLFPLFILLLYFLLYAAIAIFLVKWIARKGFGRHLNTTELSCILLSMVALIAIVYSVYYQTASLVPVIAVSTLSAIRCYHQLRRVKTE